MTAVAEAPASAPASTRTNTATAAAPVRSRAITSPTRVLLAALALFALYAALSFLNDPRGTLGTDTGGKLATLRVMDARGALDPDIGYWAEDLDPDGRLHPLWYTRHLGDRWVNLTTLPMPYVALPVFEVGGERAVLLLPMLGAVLSALAARALARRLDGERAGWWAYWTVGAATPVLVYALDFWEHALGLAAVLWSFVLLSDVAQRRAGAWGAASAGLLLGLAATMRTEALVYALVAGVAVAVVLLRRRTSSARLAGLAGAGAAGLVGALAANHLLERVTLGASLRAGRAAATASSGASGLRDRFDEAVTTFVGLNRFAEPIDWLLGALAATAVMYGAWRLVQPEARDRWLGIVALDVALLVYVLRFADGLGFVPGLLVASPLAAVGVAIGARGRPHTVVAAVALGALVLVWLFQYSGGAAPQWGGRYLLVSGALLAVLAACRLASGPRLAQVLLVGLALVVTATAVAWLSQRSHAVADAMEHIVARGDDAVISREAHLLREGGAFYGPERRWLTAVTDRDLRHAARIVRESGANEIAVLAVADDEDPSVRLPGYRRTDSETVELLPGLDVEITFYRRREVA